MESLLVELQYKWQSTIEEIHSQIDQFMSTNEIEEFDARINVLVDELNDKNNQI
jgi:hypothetical protein